jgi:hypothetical protein
MVDEALAIAVAGLISDWSSYASPVVVVDATVGSIADPRLGSLIVGHLRSLFPQVDLVVPPSPVMSLLGRGARRVSIDVSARSEQLSTVGLPRAIASAGTLIAANDLRGVDASRPTLALGIWTRFSGPRERIEARIAPREQGMDAEIALAVRPALVVLADAWQHLPVVVVTSDQIAAELIGLALRQAARDGDLERPGPWQDPLVQRATELDLGVRLPDRIAIRGAWARGLTEPAAAHFVSLIDDIAVRLGVNGVSVSRAEPGTPAI